MSFIMYRGEAATCPHCRRRLAELDAICWSCVRDFGGLVIALIGAITVLCLLALLLER